MKTRIVIIIVIGLCLAILPATAQEKARIALGDLNVQATTANFKLVGKGITELIAVELVKSKSIDLIEREKRVDLMKEMEFGLTGAAETNKAAQLGKLLLADYLAFGEAIEMGPKFLISMKLIKVESGQVVWADKIMEALTNYDYISGFFSSSILKAMAAPVAATTVAKVEQKVEKNEQALVSFAKAVEAVDKKDVATAKVELQTAQKLDPKSEAVAQYLAKLVTNTTKFKVLMEPFYSYVNPAYLGIMRTDMLHFATYMPPLFWSPSVDGLTYTSYGGDKHIFENITGGQIIGYALPIGSDLGMRASVVTGNVDNRGQVGPVGERIETSPNRSSARSAWGLILDLGWSLTQPVAIGAGLGVFTRSKKADPVAAFTSSDAVTWSANIGLLVRNADESLIFDTRFALDSETRDSFNKSTLVKSGSDLTDPLFLENTLTVAFNEKRTFLILKQINNLTYDRPGYYGTLMPAVEHFFFDWFSARAGLEGSLLSDDSTTFGFGGIGGATFRVFDWGMDIDVNLTYRLRPSYMVSGVLYKEFLLLVNLSWNGLFVKSRK